jgi:hypothetical protein
MEYPIYTEFRYLWYLCWWMMMMESHLRLFLVSDHTQFSWQWRRKFYYKCKYAFFYHPLDLARRFCHRWDTLHLLSQLFKIGNIFLKGWNTFREPILVGLLKVFIRFEMFHSNLSNLLTIILYFRHGNAYDGCCYDVVRTIIANYLFLFYRMSKIYIS